MAVLWLNILAASYAYRCRGEVHGQFRGVGGDPCGVGGEGGSNKGMQGSADNDEGGWRSVLGRERISFQEGSAINIIPD